MSHSFNFFLGPYLEIVIKREAKVVDTCGLQNCPKVESGFCPTCGRSAKDRVATYKGGSISIYEMFEDTFFQIGESLIEGEQQTERWGANHNRGQTRRCTFTADEPRPPLILHPDHPDIPEKEVEWFKRAFAKELELLEEAGPISMRICWGGIPFIF